MKNVSVSLDCFVSSSLDFAETDDVIFDFWQSVFEFQEVRIWWQCSKVECWHINLVHNSWIFAFLHLIEIQGSVPSHDDPLRLERYQQNIIKSWKQKFFTSEEFQSLLIFFFFFTINELIVNPTMCLIATVCCYSSFSGFFRPSSLRLFLAQFRFCCLDWNRMCNFVGCWCWWSSLMALEALEAFVSSLVKDVGGFSMRSSTCRTLLASHTLLKRKKKVLKQENIYNNLLTHVYFLQTFQNLSFVWIIVFRQLHYVFQMLVLIESEKEIFVFLVLFNVGFRAVLHLMLIVKLCLVFMFSMSKSSNM